MSRQVGVELEIAGINANTAVEYAEIVNGRHENDGSLREQTYGVYQDDGSVQSVILPSRRRHIAASGIRKIDDFGAEIVTPPMMLDELAEKLDILARLISVVPSTPRASIHVHVSAYDLPWKVAQNLCAWFIALEAELFRLSCGNIAHRGQDVYIDPRRGPIRQDHNYARPLTNSIGILTIDEESDDRDDDPVFVPLVNVESLLTAKTASEFLAAWGRLDFYWDGLAHYNPHRLHALNIASMKKGTFEFRLFNGVYQHAVLFATIAHNMVELAIREPAPAYVYNDPYSHALGTNPATSVDTLSSILGVDVSTLWRRDHWVKGCNSTAVPHHYGERYGRFIVDPRVSIVNVTNNAGDRDRGQADFVIYKSPR